MTIEEKQQDVIEQFGDMDDWMDKYGYIIELGSALPPIDEKHRTPNNLIEGCQSRVWLTADLTDEGKIVYTADSDAIIVKGIISLLIEVLSDQTPEDIINSDLHFIDEIGLSEHLSPTRSNGLTAMVKQMKLYAVAYKAKADASK
jgi:cysteine desulfuration protein SufE